MTQKEFNQFVDTMEQEIRSKDCVYRGFVNTNKSMLSCTYLKQTKLQKGRYISTRIYVSEWIKYYMFEVRVTIHVDGEKRKGVVPLEQNTLEHHRISAKVIDFKEVEQETIAMAQKLGWI